MTKYYLITNEYVGPNDHDSTGNIMGDTCVMSISTEPGEQNMSHDECIDGWLGTTNDIYECAHGEFETLELARETAHKMGYTEPYIDSPYFEFGDSNSSLEEWITPEAARDNWGAAQWFDATSDNEVCDIFGITAKTTDSKIRDIANDCELQAVENDNINVYNTYEYFIELRNDLIDE